MRYAQIVDGSVFGLGNAADDLHTIPCDDSVRLGWLYDGAKFTEVDLVPSPAPDPLAAAKAARIALATSEAGSRIVAAAVVGSTPLTPDQLTSAINGIRSSYNSAVAAINAMTDAASIEGFTW